MTRTYGVPQPEDPLDCVLNGLHSTEPAPGFEERLLRSLAAAQATPARPSLLARPLPWVTSVATLALFTLAVELGVHRAAPHHTEPPQPPTHILGLPSAVPRADSPAPAVAAHRTRRAKSSTPVQPSLHQDLDDTQTLAAVEAAAVSQPPPPLPLSTEERQIQRFASRHTAFDLAALAPSAEVAHAAAERRAFADFFGPDPIVLAHPALETSTTAPYATPSTNPSPATH